ncbi:MAG: hypothetical protein VX527_01135 [Planctomycetota bacterium]|nr:hypothetical protein [Planctomycetota bacterium]
MFLRLASLVLLLVLTACDEAWLEKIRGQPQDNQSTSIQWYLTLHAGPTYPQGNTIIGLGADSSAITTIPLEKTIPSSLSIGKPRSMLIQPDGRMLVASSKHDQSAIFILGLPNWQGQRAFLNVFAHRGQQDSLLIHPYDMVQAPGGDIFVTCQDSATVLRFSGPVAKQPGQPLGNYPSIGPGCFVPPRTSDPKGLKDPRGLAIGPDGLLYVVDRGDASITAWNMKDGSFVRTVASSKDGLIKPIQIIFSQSGHMFVGDRGAHTVWVAQHPDSKLKHFISKETDRPQLPSALAVDDKWLYVGDRQTKTIQRFNLEDGTPEEPAWLGRLPDEPEFLILNTRPEGARQDADPAATSN